MVQPHKNLSLLKVYLYFRAALAFLLAGMFFVEAADSILGTLYPQLFFWTSSAYAVACSFTLVFFPPHRLMRSINWLIASLTVDVAASVLMMHASGGVESGLGYLLLVFVAMGSILIRGQLAIALAAMASLFVIGESIHISHHTGATNRAIFSAGALGALLFATAYAFQFLTEKLRVSTLEAATQAEFAEHLQKLAEAIVGRMRTGILVVDERGLIELINESALQLLDLPTDVSYHKVQLADISTLHPLVDAWDNEAPGGPPRVYDLRAGQQARISMSTLDLGNTSRTVLYLEDHRAMTQQAQQMKLASLGRLTASIAHEVRNPLGAISHAAQLLAESTTITPTDIRLTEIIQQHSNRVNDIVESTLALSRRKEPRPEQLDLAQWLPRFILQYRTGQDVDIQVTIKRSQHLIKMDPTHLSQVLTNLLDNGLRYSHQETGHAKVLVLVEALENDETTYLEIVDFGAGIDHKRIPHIFDPFYTTDSSGSGLGLYISKELCEINQASLHYRPTPDGQSCFRIDFTHYQRMF